MRTAAALLALSAAACDPRPQAILMCHNSNCAHATDPGADDTMDALEASLALEYRDRPAIDGIELDILWAADSGTCVFAHDFNGTTAVSGMEAAQRVAEHIQRPQELISWIGNEFYAKIEIKSAVNADGDAHTAAQLQAHLQCAIDMAEVMSEAAIARGRELEVIFEAEEVAFLRELAVHPSWPGKSPADDVGYRFGANVKLPGLRPQDLESLGPGTTDDGIDVLAFHSTRFPDGQQQAYDALDVDLLLWMLDTSLETMHAAQIYQPRYINTGEALVIRRWMEY